jgi:hypothetical protein
VPIGANRVRWIRLNVGLRTGGTLVCTELAIEGDAITARWLRHEFRLGQVVDAIALDVAAKLRGQKGRGAKLNAIGVTGWYGGPDPKLAVELPQPRQAAVSDALLREIATRYRQLVKAGERFPIARLAKRHRWSNGQIYSAHNLRRLLRLAREAQILGPAIHGRAGERTTKRARRSPK